jgi:hypothetical protein
LSVRLAHEDHLRVAQKAERLLGCMTAVELWRMVVASKGMKNATPFLNVAVGAAAIKILPFAEARAATALIKAFADHSGCSSSSVQKLKVSTAQSLAERGDLPYRSQYLQSA